MGSSLSDRACVTWFEYCIGNLACLATLVPVGSMHRLYVYSIQKIINNNYKLN